MQTLTHIAVTSNPPLVDYEPTLDVVNDQLEAGRIAQPLDLLFDDLAERRLENTQDWPDYARSCLNHPLRSLLHQDPFTFRAFAKPRGYAGDAVMMDYIYGLGEASQAAGDASPLGRAIFQYMGTRPSAKAVRYRRQLLAKLVDQVARRGGSSVLAIAAGHLREVELSRAVHTGKLEEYVAFDQDEASLKVVAREYAHLGVQTIAGSVRQILAGKANLGQYDLVYAAGLYDYLNDAAATALTRRMFEMTRPGGLMLVPNFLVGARDTGYMESFMDWHLIYRNHADMRALADALPRGEVANCRIFDDPDDTITFLLVSKADEAL
jgi:extracellular factor (EF) 3-hydroxypalmitic acid methyl ester biosynthesis protein